MATIKKTVIQKYRPYLSLDELNLLSKLCAAKLCETPMPGLAEINTIKSSMRALNKIIMGQALELNEPAYTARPRPTMNQKLGFEDTPETPDFDSLFASINSAPKGIES